MSTPRQDTINKWVNLEALGAYADRLRSAALNVESSSYWDGPSDVEVATLAATAAAATALSEAIHLCILAEQCSRDAFRERVYKFEGLTLGPVAGVIALLTS